MVSDQGSQEFEQDARMGVLRAFSPEVSPETYEAQPDASEYKPAPLPTITQYDRSEPAPIQKETDTDDLVVHAQQGDLAPVLDFHSRLQAALQSAQGTTSNAA